MKKFDISFVVWIILYPVLKAQAAWDSDKRISNKSFSRQRPDRRYVVDDRGRIWNRQHEFLDIVPFGGLNDSIEMRFGIPDLRSRSNTTFFAVN